MTLNIFNEYFSIKSTRNRQRYCQPLVTGFTASLDKYSTLGSASSDKYHPVQVFKSLALVALLFDIDGQGQCTDLENIKNCHKTIHHVKTGKPEYI